MVKTQERLKTIIILLLKKGGKDMACIYKATFKCNGKSYIGQTRKSFKERQKGHKDSYRKRINRFYAAIRSHGWDELEWTILEECSIDKLNEREVYWIAYYRTYIGFEDCNGYNMTLGGDGTSNPYLFTTQEEVNDLLEAYKECGSINQLCEEYGCGYTVIHNILTGMTRQEFTGFEYNDKTFIHKYIKKGLKYTNEQIQDVIDRNKAGETNPNIAKEMGVPIKWVQDILSGRTMSKRTGIKHVTRKERQQYNPVNSKLTKEQVLEMVDLYYNQEWEPVDIAAKFGKSVNRIYEILKRDIWSDITGIKKIKQLPRSKNKRFTKEEVLLIVEENKQGLSREELAEKHGTSKAYIGAILYGEKWNSVTHLKD